MYSFTEDDKSLVLSLLEWSMQFDEERRHHFGEDGCNRLDNLRFRLKYEEYCSRHHTTYEELTEDDFERYDEEEYEKMLDRFDPAE